MISKGVHHWPCPILAIRMMKDKVLVLVIDELQTHQTLLGNENVLILMEYFQIEFLDIRGLNSQWRIDKKNFRFEDEKSYKVTYINNKRDLRKEFLRFKSVAAPVAFLFSGKLRWWNRQVFLELKRVKIPYFVRRNKTHPFAQDTQFKSLITNRIDSRIRRLINVLRNRLPVDWFLNFGLSKPVKLFLGTRFDLNSINYNYEANDIVFTHFKDYDNYLRLSSPVQPTEKYIAYVDQYFPFHPELHELRIDPYEFYFSLCRFLRDVSLLTGMIVKICLHPATDIPRVKEFFSDFEICTNRTTEVLSGSEFGIFFSSSMILTCLFTKKPLLMIKSNRILPKEINGFNKFYEKLLGVESWDIDSRMTIENLDANLLAISEKVANLFPQYIKHQESAMDLEYKIIADTVNSCI